MKIARILAGLCAGLLLQACATRNYCAKAQPYQTAPSVPLIQPAGTLDAKPSANALLIPPGPIDPVPFGQKVPDPRKPGSTTWSCLDQPPAFVPPKPKVAAPIAKPS